MAVLSTPLGNKRPGYLGHAVSSAYLRCGRLSWGVRQIRALSLSPCSRRPLGASITTASNNRNGFSPRGLGSRCRRGWDPSERSTGRSFLPLSASGGCRRSRLVVTLWSQCSSLCFRCLMASSTCVFTWLFYKDTSHWTEGPPHSSATSS